MTSAPKTKTLVFIIILLLLSNIAMVLFFVSRKDGAKKTSHQARPAFSITNTLEKEVGFSKAQIDQFEKLKGVHKARMKPMFDDIRMAKEQFYRQLGTDSSSNASFKDASSIGEKQAAIEMQIFRHFSELRNLCTPEQKPKYDSVMQQVFKKMVFPSRRGNGRSKDDSIKKHH